MAGLAPLLAVVAGWLGELQALEREAVRWVSCTLHTPWLDPILLGAQDKKIAVPVLLVVLALMALWRPRAALRAFLACALAWGLAMGLATILWATIDRTRPPNTFEVHLRGEAEVATCASRPDALAMHVGASTSPSFPSRHGLTIGVFVAALWLASWPVGVGAGLFGLLAGVGRVYSAKHYPSDVVVGVLLGALLAWAAWRLVPRVLGLVGRAGWVREPPRPSSEG